MKLAIFTIKNEVLPYENIFFSIPFLQLQLQVNEQLVLESEMMSFWKMCTFFIFPKF